jgi:2-polyprenyl-3-methyl-5-hydroxy-6-metoxy-1,4-benzoquinol methylase
MTNSTSAASAGTVAGASRSDLSSRRVIAVTIIGAVPEPDQLERFYEDAYSEDAASSARHARWRALGALGKAEHVIELCARAGIDPASTLDVGCGDGALLSELHRRRFGGRLSGVEISHAAVAIASQRREIATVARYDGASLPAADDSYDLGILSHVLEHVADPSALLAEVARACRAVLLEVPLEGNLSARRASRRVRAAGIGHIQRLDRAAVARIVGEAGLSIACELQDPLPRAVHLFFAATRRARALATAKWALRATLHRAAPATARRVFTVHYAALCLPGG